MWITFWPLTNPWLFILIVFGIPETDVAEVIPESLKFKGLIIVLRLASLYFTVTVVVNPGLTLMITESLLSNPWVPVPTTLTTVLSISPLITFLNCVFKLWTFPDPAVRKNNNPLLLKVVPIPTKVPVDPNPTLDVDNPIKLSFNFATKRGASSVSKVSWVGIALLVFIPKAVPDVW